MLLFVLDVCFNLKETGIEAVPFCILPKWSLLEECLARFLSRPVRSLSSMSLSVPNRSSRMGSILSCSSTTPLSTDDHWQR